MKKNLIHLALQAALAPVASLYERMYVLNVMVTSNQQQIGAGTTNGLVVQPALDSAGNPAKLAFLGNTPAVQRAGGNQLSVSQQQSNGVLININSVTITPTNVSTVSTAPVVLTMTGAGILSSDHVVVNKITAQAGLGVGNARAGTTADTVVVDYVNLSNATITPTAESYLVAALRGVAGTTTLTPASIGSNSAVEQTFTVPGLAPGMLVNVIKPTDQGVGGPVLAGARVVSNNTLGITFLNPTGAAMTPTAGESYSYINLNGLNPASPMLTLGINVGTLNSTVSTSLIEQNITSVSGLLATDVTVGPPMRATFQSSAVPVMSRITAANVLAVTILNYSGTAGITPTASEVWQQNIVRKSPSAPLALYSVALTPIAVAPNTTAEQGFTVTGLVASTVVLVNKPSFTSGLGIVGSRVSAANVLGITYANPTTQTITPPAETYLVGNFQALAGVGNNVQQAVSPAQNATINLVNELRAALAPTTGFGLIAGA